MKILWLNNFPLPWIASKHNLSLTVNEGWVQGMFNGIRHDEDKIELSIAYPQTINRSVLVDEIENVKYYGFYKSNCSTIEYDYNWEKDFNNILIETKPNVIHLMGCEYPFTLAMVKSIIKNGFQERAVLSIQGLTSVYSRHYLSGIPNNILKHKTIRDFIKCDGLLKQQKLMQKRGMFEQASIRLVLNVIGRTDWDEACTKIINSSRKYFYNGETLRNDFYSANIWNISNIEKHTLFVSQATNPIKGLHFMIEALYEIKKVYNDVCLYVAGNNIYNVTKWKMSTYARYINNKIHEFNLENNVVFLGPLMGDEMKKRYLSSHVFVSPSSIENSPNSLGEAMILGVPSISSDVGGVKNLLEHGEEGYVYPADEPYMLTHYIAKIFENDDLAMKFSKKARIHALKEHDPKTNLEQLIHIYSTIIHSNFVK